MSNIPLGFEISTGRPVSVPLGHAVIVGQTQSGKTTCTEALASRSDCRVVAFVTKRGEGSFRVAAPIPPYFCERCDWPFVAAILEATVSERLKFQRSEIIRLCQDYSGPEGTWRTPHTLADVARNAEIALLKARGISARVYTELAEYLRMVLPEIERLPYTDKLVLRPGMNVIDLEAYDFPLQALVVRSVLEWIQKNAKNTVAVIPEAWRMAPKHHNSPVKMAAEELIRQGAALGNFLWCDVQDLAGLASVLLRQMKVWIFGVQRDPREIERTLEHIPANLQRPSRADIATLGCGQFIAVWEKEMRRVYVQPAWMTATHAQAIARGEESVDSAREIVRDFDAEHQQP